MLAAPSIVLAALFTDTIENYFICVAGDKKISNIRGPEQNNTVITPTKLPNSGSWNTLTIALVCAGAGVLTILVIIVCFVVLNK